jgi:hypothetical protein
LMWFDLPSETNERFRALPINLREGVPPALSRADLEGDALYRWRTEFARRTQHVRDGLAAAYYHHRNVRELEGRIVAACEGHEDDLHELGGGFGFGSLPLTFEYQAFVQALHNTLNYLGRAVGYYFPGIDCQSFRRLEGAIRNAQPEDRREAVRATLRRELPGLQLTRDDFRAVRDRVTHWHPVYSGSFNATPQPDGRIVVSLLGGGELEGLPPSEAPASLADALALRLRKVERVIFALYADLGLFDSERVPEAAS